MSGRLSRGSGPPHRSVNPRKVNREYGPRLRLVSSRLSLRAEIQQWETLTRDAGGLFPVGDDEELDETRRGFLLPIRHG
jgi:hypothetical protein